jgi:hypothetical protein
VAASLPVSPLAAPGLDRLLAAADVELAVDLLHVGVDGGVADAELRGDLLVKQARGEAREDFLLAGAERFAGRLAEDLDDLAGHHAIHRHAAGDDLAEGGQQIVPTRGFEQVAARPGAQRAEDQVQPRDLPVPLFNHEPAFDVRCSYGWATWRDRAIASLPGIGFARGCWCSAWLAISLPSQSLGRALEECWPCGARSPGQAGDHACHAQLVEKYSTRSSIISMKPILISLTLAAVGMGSLSATSVYTNFSINAGTSNVGTFSVVSNAIYDLSTLAPAADYNYAYAYRFFTPSVTGTYAIGMTNASYDPVLLVYQGIRSFNTSDPQAGLMDMNDDGAWTLSFNDDFTISYFQYGTQIVNDSAADGKPGYMPLSTGLNLVAGVDYLVALTSYDPFGGIDGPDDGPAAIPLPADLFVAGPGAVALDGVAAVPEPGSTFAVAGLLGTGLLLRRRKGRAN